MVPAGSGAIVTRTVWVVLMAPVPMLTPAAGWSPPVVIVVGGSVGATTAAAPPGLSAAEMSPSGVSPTHWYRRANSSETAALVLGAIVGLGRRSVPAAKSARVALTNANMAAWAMAVLPGPKLLWMAEIPR